jgi:hypothetical protein
MKTGMGSNGKKGERYGETLEKGTLWRNSEEWRKEAVEGSGEILKRGMGKL